MAGYDRVKLRKVAGLLTARDYGFPFEVELEGQDLGFHKPEVWVSDDKGELHVIYTNRRVGGRK